MKRILILLFGLIIVGVIGNRIIFQQKSTSSPQKLEEASESAPTPHLPLLSWQKDEGVRVSGATSTQTIFREGKYWTYYTGMGGIYLASSDDGLEFRENGKVLENGLPGKRDGGVTNPTVFQLKDGRYRMIFEGIEDYTIRKLYSAVSSDGLKWTKEEGVRLEDSIFYTDQKKGTSGEMIFTSVPEVIRLKNDCLRMYYTVVDESRIAESCDEGKTWEKKGKIMFDDYPKVTQDPDIVVLEDGTYKLFFSTQDEEKTKQWIVSASSEDGVNFKIDQGERVEPSFGNTRAVDPDIIKLPDGRYRMYYGEGSFTGDNFNVLSAISNMK